MLEIYLCRHGQSVANANGKLAGHTDSPLSAVGIQQAREVANQAKLAGLRFDRVYSSPLKRAWKTAQIIAKTTSSPAPEIMRDLIERDFGVLTGKSYSDIPKLAPEMLGTDEIGYFLKAPGSESYPKVLKRAQEVLSEIHRNHKDGKVLLVAHGDIGIMLFAAFHKTAWKEALAHFHFGNSDLLLLKEDSYHKPHIFVIDQRGLKEKA